MIKGTTSDKLDQIQSYDKVKPFQVGINGVTNITYYSVTANTYNAPSSAITRIDYTIGDVNYSTFFAPPFVSLEEPGSVNGTEFFTFFSGYDFEPEILPPNIQNTFDIKEENKMGMVFPPKVINELFIERNSAAVFERYSRLSEIKTIGSLENYKNGYYNIVVNR